MRKIRINSSAMIRFKKPLKFDGVMKFNGLFISKNLIVGNNAVIIAPFIIVYKDFKGRGICRDVEYYVSSREQTKVIEEKFIIARFLEIRLPFDVYDDDKTAYAAEDYMVNFLEDNFIDFEEVEYEGMDDYKEDIYCRLKRK